MRLLDPTLTQQLIWLDQLITDSPSKYNIGGYALLEGELCPSTLEAALKTVLRSQEVYSTIFLQQNNALQYYIKDAAQLFSLAMVDLSDDINGDCQALHWMEHDFSVPFVLYGDYLFRLVLIKVSSCRYYCYAKLHHLISDGWSFKLLLDQMAAGYSAIASGTQPDFPQYSYTDYASEDAAYYRSDESVADRQFWLSTYMTLPAQLFHKKRQNHVPAHVENAFTLSINTTAKQMLQEIAKPARASVFHVLVSLLLIYLGRTRRQEQIALALPVLNRTKKVYKATAGVFMNLICPQFQIDFQATFQELLGNVKQKMYECLKHQRYQYGNLVKDLKLHQQNEGLYQIRLSYEDFDFTHQLGDVRATATALSNHYEAEPLAIYIRDYHHQGFDIRFVYNEDYFDKSRVQEIAAGLEFLITHLDKQQDKHVSDMSLMPDSVKASIADMSRGSLRTWGYPSFIEMWLDAVKQFPEQIAVSCNDEYLTYSALHTRALSVAAQLRQQSKWQERQVVALLLPRNLFMITAMLGSMMAGMAYMPLDPEEPAERIKTILKSTGCNTLLTNSELLPEGLAGEIDVVLAENIYTTPATVVIAEITPTQDCYIIYTSGSNGVPKGVAVSHAAMINYICNFQDYFSPGAGDTILQMASVNFDISVEEIFPLLGVGGRVHILEERRNMQQLYDAILHEGITIISSTPLIINQINAHIQTGQLRTVISGGDVLLPGHVNKLLAAGVEVFNTYGPTEGTVCVSYHRVTWKEEIIPIGKPIINCQVFVLDKCRQLQPAGVIGDIYIGGTCLATRYKNDPALTRARFVDHPFSPGEKLYQTGDLGYYTDDGMLVYEGRNDAQLKIRGIRVEAGEIVAVLEQHPAISRAIVVKDISSLERGGLAAFLVVDKVYTPSPSDETLRDFVHSFLPGYMVPYKFIRLEEIPLTDRGKPDLSVLQTSLNNESDATGSRTRILPANRNERLLEKIWKDLLDVKDISVTDNFFELGGHSLLVGMLANAIYEKWNIEINISGIFSSPTIRQLAKVITDIEEKQFDNIELC